MWKVLLRNTPSKKKFSPMKSRFLIPFLVGFIFILFEGCGSLISIITNSIELNRSVDKFTRCISLMLFATAEISDALTYIILQKYIRKKNSIIIKNCLW